MAEYDFCFISYSRADQARVNELIEQLEKIGVKVYIDYRDIPPGSVYAEEIVNAIENSICCILMFTEKSNDSRFVLNEMNSATNYNKTIIPLRLDSILPSKALCFYIGKYNWIDYIDSTSLEKLKKTVGNIQSSAHTSNIKCVGPAVYRSEKLLELGYTVEKKVVETIEIDYRTLKEAPDEFHLTEESEGTIYDWIEYAKNYPETSSMLIVNDRIVGYYQLIFMNEENFTSVTSGEKMANASMEEFYGFGGQFCCYIAVMPILRQYESSNNYMLLLKDLFAKIVDLSKDGIIINRFGISVYTPLLEKIASMLGFKQTGTNPVGGKIMELSAQEIRSNSIYKNRYPDFYKIYGEKSC